MHVCIAQNFLLKIIDTFLKYVRDFAKPFQVK